MGIYTRELQKFPVYKKPPTYHISKDGGIGNFLDAPGYPSHKLHSVYTQYGNNPSKGADTVLYFGGEYYAMPRNFWDREVREKILRKMWIPEPLESAVVQDWIKQVKTHYRHCYVDPNSPTRSHVVWPVSKFYYPVEPKQTYKDYHGNIYVMGDSDYRKVRSVYRAQVKAILRAAWSVASNPDNDAATVHIRKFYPDYKPESEN